MNAGEWERIKDTFAAALALPEAERDEFVTVSCKGNQAMLETVLDLLANHDHSPVYPDGVSGDRLLPLVFNVGDLVAERFRVTRFLARGGMGEVYEVWDERLRLCLALKTLRPELASDAESLQRFRREVLITRDVAHENLCRIYDFVEHCRKADSSTGVEGSVVACLTMEYLQGESLSELLARGRPLGAELALEFAIQIAAGLDALHGRGIVHRDLKPSNIMLAARRDGPVRVVVMDFGLAKSGGQEGEVFESLLDRHAGAPYFMAPELFRNHRPSKASDIYAFGLILDEMVTQSRAFTAQSVQAMCFAKLCETPIPPQERADGLSSNWEAAIVRCLATEPAQRPARAGDVVAVLQSGAIPVPPVSWHGFLRQRMGRYVIGATVAGGLALAGVAADTALTPTSADIEVFNIDNQTSSHEFDYFCSGTTSELRRRLTQLEGVRVVPLHSTRRNSNVQRHARFGLEGMLLAHKGQVRLTIQMVDNQHGALVWADNFDRDKIDNPIDLQSDIAREAVGALKKRLMFGGKGEPPLPLFAKDQLGKLFAWPLQRQLPGPTTSSNHAFDLYLRAHQLLEEVNAESALAAAAYLERAVSEDPGFALGWSSLAEANVMRTDFHDAPQADLIERAGFAARNAVEKGPELAEAHASLALVRQISLDWEGAESSYREALRLKPSFARARRWFSGMLLQRGQASDAIAETQRAISDDPYDRASPTTYGLYLFLAGRNREASEVLEAAVAGKDAPGTRLNLGQVYARMGYLSSGEDRRLLFGKAIAEAQTVAAIEKRAQVAGRDGEARALLSDQMFALIYTQAGDYRSATPFLEKLTSAMNAGMVSPTIVAWVYAIQGDQDRAIALLAQAARKQDRKLLYSKVVPYFESLRENPRFQALMSHIRL
jgi:eukaryotic-like serine/threonine-protein kinase